MDDRARLLERCARIAASGTSERLKHAADLAERWRRDRAAAGLEIEAWAAFWEGRLRTAATGDLEAGDAAGATDALRAVLQARTDLQTQVLPRVALDLMLLSFPRATIEGVSERDPIPNA
jgi:hypothetical protein